MSKSIDLGRRHDDGMIAISEVSGGGKTHYPHFYIDTDNTDLLNLPDSGKCEIEYKVVHRTHTEDKRDGKRKKSCAITLEVKAIAPPKGVSYNRSDKEAYGDGARKSMKDYFKDK